MHLSKSRFLQGLQCPKLLWWAVHEPEAPELVWDAAQEAILERGHRVGELARTYVPGGVLIDLPHQELAARVAATRKAIAEGAQVLYEASFLEDGVFVAVDILDLREGALIEVKSTTVVKFQHLPDVAIQLHVLRRAGLPIGRAEVMHLDRECRYPDLSKLFARVDVTERAEALLAGLPAEVEGQLRILAGELPEAPTGLHCDRPYGCPFRERCWPEPGEHDVEELYGWGPGRTQALRSQGLRSLLDLPEDFPGSAVVRRQLESVRTGRVVVEPGLGAALADLEGPLGFLDFETVAPAVPVWPGCRPYDPVPAQFSLHGVNGGRLLHHAHLAEGPGDPRPALAEALVRASAGARTLLAYNAAFERRCLLGLAEAVPSLGHDLRALAERVVDLLPIVRDHVYHPGFRGSFSLKSVLPALVPALGYQDLEIAEGQGASLALEALLLEPSGEGTEALRAQLLAYCERDTLAMVQLLDRLRSMAERGVK